MFLFGIIREKNYKVIKIAFDNIYINNPEYAKHIAKYGKPIPIRLNDEERRIIEEWQDLADIGSQSEAIKTLMKIGNNVIHNRSNADVFARLFKKERQRKTDQ